MLLGLAERRASARQPGQRVVPTLLGVGGCPHGGVQLVSGEVERDRGLPGSAFQVLPAALDVADPQLAHHLCAALLGAPLNASQPGPQ